MIRAVIFDCFGVLYRGSLEYLYELTPADQHQQLRDIAHSSDYGYLSRQEYLDQVSQLTGKSSNELLKVIDSQHVRSEPMFELVKSLRVSGIKTALLSNVGQDAMSRLFTKRELQDLFNVVVLSSQVGMVKPNQEIYELTAQRLGEAPEDCIMIDDLETNCFGATQVGMQAICHQTYDKTYHELEKILQGEKK